ncbi:hypothetical protein Ahy_A03g013322 [Arachis hypogaea]|uniref:alpha,alpha-trehalase n=1 Tax=Arachis hypogaea TaxID=3818 RepID=A0A445DV51_ARAHY|nr:hypothetical protein Ahy_A03g013322 [Arachis hypogaea]
MSCVNAKTHPTTMELNIAFFAKAIGDGTTAKHFMELSNASKKAINSVFWSASKKQWLDY